MRRPLCLSRKRAYIADMKQHPLHWLPNFLTLLRPIMSILIAWMIVKIAVFEAAHGHIPMDETQFGSPVTAFRHFWGGLAFVTFSLAAVTDWLDGYLARKWHAETRFGRLLDPIADKIMVNLPLLAIAWATSWALPVLVPVCIIICRDALITGLRFSGLKASTMAVSFTAKLKTFMEMILLALFLAILALLPPTSDWTRAILTSWMFALWGVAFLSAWTGIVYLLRLSGSPPPDKTRAEQ